MPEGDLELGRDPLDVGLQESRAEVPGGLRGRPRDAGLLVRPEQHPTALLADVDLAAEVERHRHLLARGRNVGSHLGHVVGDDVHVLHGQDRQLDPDHSPYLAGPQPGGVDDMLGVDRRADVRVDVPGPVEPLAQGVRPGVPVDLGAGLPGRDRIGVGDAGRIDVALDRVVQGTDEMPLVEERKELLCLRRSDQLEVHAQVPAARLGHPQEVHPHARVRQHDAAGQVDAAVLPGDLLDLAVELDRVLLELGHVRIAVEGVHPTGRVPGGPRGELPALEQDHIGPAGPRQVVQNAAADDAAADDDDPGGRLHAGSPRDALNSRWARRPRPCAWRRTRRAPRPRPGPAAGPRRQPAGP